MVVHPSTTEEGLNNQTFLTPQVFDGLAGFQHGLSLSGVESHEPLLCKRSISANVFNAEPK